LRAASVLEAADIVYLAAMAAASLGALAWRRRSPASFARRRELPAALFRLAVAASPTAWTISRQAMEGTPPYAGNPLRNAAVFLLSVCFASFAATATVLVRASVSKLIILLIWLSSYEPMSPG
jgi:hypothetical protein